MSFLSIVWNVDPEIFSIGPVSIRWYSLMWIIGFYFGVRLFMWFFKREGLPLKLIDPLLLTMVFSVAIGARLGHVFFYQPDYYLANPVEILKIWEGGLSSHGGAIGILLGLWWFVHKYGKPNGFGYMWLLDRMVIAVALCGSFIRLGNLMNSEIIGAPTDLPWGFEFIRSYEWQKLYGVPCHPAQIYESLTYLGIFFLLFFLYKKYLGKLRQGFLFGLFFITVFVARFLIEFIKAPQVDAEIGMTINIGQILSIPCIMAGICLIVYSFKRGEPDVIEKKPVYDYRTADNNKNPKKK